MTQPQKAARARSIPKERANFSPPGNFPESPELPGTPENARPEISDRLPELPENQFSDAEKRDAHRRIAEMLGEMPRPRKSFRRVYIPTPREIRKQTALIRASWTEQERARRLTQITDTQVELRPQRAIFDRWEPEDE